MTEQRAYTKRQAAEALGISLSSVERLIRAGQLDTCGALGKVSVPVSSIDAYIRRTTRTRLPEPEPTPKGRRKVPANVVPISLDTTDLWIEVGLLPARDRKAAR